MKKYFLLLFLAIALISCSKGGKVTLTGNLKNANPLERIELIETSGIATLPVANFGTDAKGNFSETFEIPKNGVYLITYAGSSGFIYLKGGDKVDIKTDAVMFPTNMQITGDAKGNTEFLTESQKYINDYLSKINQSVAAKNESDFLKELEKYKKEITAQLDKIAETKKPDSDVKKVSKEELDVTLLRISSQYEAVHGQMTNNPNFKPSQKFLDFQKSLENEDFVESMPTYRNYLLSKYGSDIQKFFQTTQKGAAPNSNVEVFAKFLDTRKDITDKTKDYLLATVATQFDLQPNNPKIPEIMKVLDSKVKSESIKAELKKVEEAIYGLPVGTDYSKTELVKLDGKKSSLSELKGKPTLVVFYASWNPYLNQNTVPVLKEMINFYKTKINFAFVNLDDTQDQFKKTANAVFKGVNGVSFYGEKGMKSDIAKQFAIYGFKMPSFVILDKDAKVAGKTYLNIGDPLLVDALNKASGLTPPSVVPNPQMMPQMGAPAPAAPTK
ncbi:thioredoxin-like domain-containing protein [Cloacibacterium sp.]|uniref:thioredoxin-like domain-containing protein n=1 Tax=Cloacibacterium sp. TaxID=1913682 RepID=UPI0035B2827E